MAQVFSSAAHREAGRAKMAMILKSCRCRFRVRHPSRLDRIRSGALVPDRRACWRL